MAAWLKIALCLLESYALAFVAMYLWKLCAAVPIMLKERDLEIARLTPSRSPDFRGLGTISIVQTVIQPNGELAVSVNALLEVRYLGGEQGDTSIHSVQLHLLNPKGHSIIVDHVWPLNARVMSRRFNLAIDNLDQTKFSAAQKSGLQWKFTFKDIHDRPFESEVFPG